MNFVYSEELGSHYINVEVVNNKFQLYFLIIKKANNHGSQWNIL